MEEKSSKNKVEFEKSFGYLMSQLEKRRRRYMDEKLREYNFRGPMYLFLLSLAHNPGSSQDFLVEHFYMDKGNVARISRFLEESGYIRRDIHPEDKRQYKLFLTDKGQAMLPIIRSLINIWSQALTEGMTEYEKGLAVTLLERMLHNANKNYNS